VIALLDVSLLVALFDPEHVHHLVAHDWLADNVGRTWASCPMTENGALRVLATPTLDLGVPINELVGLLRTFRERTHHEFWPDDLSLLDSALVDAGQVRGYKQLTDVYLLALAVKNGGRLVTFDGGIPLAAVKGARPEHLVVLASAE
jgi:toxin-antitoxin system PIN domain toxin